MVSTLLPTTLVPTFPMIPSSSNACDADETLGAGENDVTLESIDTASIGFLNGTNQQFDLSAGLPWGMVMDIYDNYAGMSPSLIRLLIGSEDTDGGA